MVDTAKDCKDYIKKGGRCASSDAPRPGHSRCKGKKDCGSYKKALA